MRGLDTVFTRSENAATLWRWTQIYWLTQHELTVGLLVFGQWPKNKTNKAAVPKFKIRLLTTLPFFSAAWQLRYFTRGVPGTHSSCGSAEEGTCEITWHVNRHCMVMIRIHQILQSAKQTGEVVITDQLCVWSTYLVVAALRFGERLQ